MFFLLAEAIALMTVALSLHECSAQTAVVSQQQVLDFAVALGKQRLMPDHTTSIAPANITT